MNLLKKLLNIIFFLCLILIFFIIFEPLLYGKNSKGYICRSDEEYFTALSCVTRYIDGYYDEDYDYIKKSNTIFKRKNIKKYQEVSENVKEEFKNVMLYSVERINDVYIIDYSINIPVFDDTFLNPKVNRLVVKALNGKMKVYYDSLIVE